VVREGAARCGTEEGMADGVEILHAQRSGDDALIAAATEATDQVTLVSADRARRQRALCVPAETGHLIRPKPAA